LKFAFAARSQAIDRPELGDADQLLFRLISARRLPGGPVNLRPLEWHNLVDSGR
jgi:hypothetical protein